MKILYEWSFVGYGMKLDTEENDIGYVITHPRPGESLEAAVERAKEQLMEKYEERKEGSSYWWSLCNMNDEDESS